MSTLQADADTSDHRWLVLFVVATGTLLNTLAGSSVNLALPSIGHELGISIELSRWVVLAFMLPVTVLLLVAGRASDLLGHRTVYQSGFALFGLASLVCGLSGPFWMLVTGRALQGMGAAMIIAAGPALLTTSFPGAQRGRALGMLATATYVGLTFGPTLGGVIIEGLGWRWIFLLNVPVAVVMIVLGQLFLPVPRRRPAAFDGPGALALVVGLPLLLLAVTQGTEWGWGAWPTLASGGAGLLVLAAFVRLELHRRQPLLDLSLFRSPVFTGAVLSALGNYVAIFVPIILLPFFLLEALRMGSSHAGMMLGVMPMVMALVASPAGWVSDRIGTRLLSVLGLLILAAGLGGLGLLEADPLASTSPARIGFWLAVMGLGTGVFITPNSSALMGAASRDQQGVAGGVMALARTFGMMVGVAAGTAVFRAAGGQTGRAWGAVDQRALGTALLVAAGVSVLGALAAALRGRSPVGAPERK